MKIFKLFLATLAVAFLLIAISAAMPVQTQPQPTGAQQQAFDHNNCQYPDRWSNPPNGCDNSDPAVPECIKAFSTKAGEDACIADFVEQNKGTAEKREAIKEHSKPFQQPANQCGGK